MPNQWFWVMRGATLVLAVWFILCFIGVALLSLAYPYHLEWMEGQIIDVVARVVEGKPLYVEPSLEYVPFLYTPLYFYASAFVAWFTGVDFFPARLVSFFSALGCGAILYAWIRKEMPGHIYAIIGAGLFFATYKLSGRWFDVARNDSFSLFLALAGLFVLFHYSDKKKMVAAGVLIAAAFFAKQSTVIFTLPALLVWIVIAPQKWLAAAVAAILAAAGMAWMNHASEGWFWYYVFEVPAAHKWKYNIIDHFWGQEILKPMGFTVLLSLFALWQIVIRDKKRALAYVAFVAGCIGCSFVMRLHEGGWINVLMPAYAALALLSALALPYTAPVRWRRVAPSLTALMLIHLTFLLYNPFPLIPTQENVETGNRFLAEIAKIDGEILIPDLQFVQTRVGKKSYALGMPYIDIMRTRIKDKDRIRKKLRYDMAGAVRARRFAAVVPNPLVPMHEREGNYALTMKLEYPREFVTQNQWFYNRPLYMRYSRHETEE